MTIEQAKRKLLIWFNAQIGVEEGENNWNVYADDPNMTKLLGWNAQNQPWCNIFVNAGFISVFGLSTGAAMIYQKVGSGSALCRTSQQFFIDNGAFFKTPEVCDVIFFYSGGAVNHQGIVVKVDGGTVETIEGNSSDRVARRSYHIGDNKISGYGRPNWSLVVRDGGIVPSTYGQTLNIPSTEIKGENVVVSSVKEQSTVSSTVSISLPVIRKNMTGAAVAMMQGALKYHKYPLGTYGVDGDYGAITERALKLFQSGNGLSADGVCGQKTWEALLK